MTDYSKLILTPRHTKQDAFRHLTHLMQVRRYEPAARLAKEIFMKNWLLSAAEALNLLVAYDAGTDDLDVEGHRFVDRLREEVSKHKKKHAAEIIEALAVLAEIHLGRRNLKRASGVFGTAREFDLQVPTGGGSEVLHYNEVLQEYANLSGSDTQEVIDCYRLG